MQIPVLSGYLACQAHGPLIVSHGVHSMQPHTRHPRSEVPAASAVVHFEHMRPDRLTRSDARVVVASAPQSVHLKVCVVRIAAPFVSRIA